MSFSLAIFAGIPFLILATVTFIDGVERAASRLGLTRFATGALLVAALTALPETVIAILSGIRGGDAYLLVGAGSILAAPSITILLGAPIILLTTRWRKAAGISISQNYILFATVFLPSILVLIFIEQIIVRYALSLGLMVLYVVLARRIYLEEDELMEGRQRSLLERLLRVDSMPLSLVQVLASLSLMIYAADLFMDGVAETVEALTYSLILSPFGTCLEEVLVAAYWTARRKSDIALSLLSGENLIQATLVLGIGTAATGMWLTAGSISIAAVYTAAALILAAALRKGIGLLAAPLLLMLYPLYILAALRV
ncbi:MAG: hypothetical protein RMJ28_04350 [Nitrososphaerota archaeon]|nr:hypothetical protein [Candidatus Calditenuaceae archaeon]MDW8073451.1 hypothetical protein [Nitrososphaerota archaeon]